MFIFGGFAGNDNLNETYELTIESFKKLTFAEVTNANDNLTQLAEGPFAVLLSFLDATSIARLSCTSRFLRQRRCFNKMNFLAQFVFQHKRINLEKLVYRSRKTMQFSKSTFNI